MPGPLLLALDSATRTPSAALLRGERLLCERSGQAGGRGASGLLPMVDALLCEAGVGIADLEAYALCIGPGSFTGLRVAVATLKGFAFGTEVPVVPVCTLEAIARGADCEPRLSRLALLDARRGEAYAALFEPRGDALCEVLEAGVYAPAVLAGALGARCALVGEGAPLFEEEIRRVARHEVFVAPAGGASLARVVGAIGSRSLARGGGQTAAQLVPRYLRRAQAEVERTSLRFEGPG